MGKKIKEFVGAVTGAASTAVSTSSTEAVSTAVSTAGTAGFVLMALGYVGTSTMLPILVPTLLISSGLVALVKLARAGQLHVAEETKKLRNSEFATGVTLAATTTAGAGIFVGNATAQAGVAMAVGLVAHPVLAVATLGLAINAWNDVFVNYSILQKFKPVTQLGRNVPSSDRLVDHSADLRDVSDNLDEDQAPRDLARSLMNASLVKAIGYTGILAGSTVIAASFAPLLVGAGLVGVAGSHLYNNRAHISFGLFGLAKRENQSFSDAVVQRTSLRPI